MAFALPADGVLPAQWLRKAMSAGVIVADEPIPDANVQPSSLDLRLGPVAYRLRCSFLARNTTVVKKLEDFQSGPPIDITSGAVLERNTPYLIPLQEKLALPPNLRALANPKSSTGRLDVFTRLITDRSSQFDEVRRQYEGDLYLEVVPRSFTIMVRTGLSLNQLRLHAGVTRADDQEIRDFHRRDPILFRDGKPVPANEFRTQNGLFVGLDLEYEPDRVVGYRAKRNSRLIDMSNVDHYDPEDFWEPIRADRKSQVVLEPEEFYLLLSDEAIRIPPEYAAEMVAYDPTSGELRTHYAGFFDPGFGHDPVISGSRAALEVRAHDVAFVVEHRQRICKLRFERMLDLPDISYGSQLGSNYQGQEATLSKHFRFERRQIDGQLAIPLEEGAGNQRAPSDDAEAPAPSERQLFEEPSADGA